MQRPNQENRKRKSRGLEHWQIISALLMIYDFIVVCLAYFLALWLRFDGLVRSIPQYYYRPYIQFIFPCAAGSVIVFLFFRMYNSMWRFASFTEFVRTVIGSFISSLSYRAN